MNKLLMLAMFLQILVFSGMFLLNISSASQRAILILTLQGGIMIVWLIIMNEIYRQRPNKP
jgi:hypothetical protein